MVRKKQYLRLDLTWRSDNNQQVIQAFLLEAFSLDSVMTAYFDTGYVDQLLVEVVMNGINNTRSKTSQSYKFNAQAGTVTPSPIVMSLLDVNGDKRTGLEEAIFSLNRLIN